MVRTCRALRQELLPHWLKTKAQLFAEQHDSDGMYELISCWLKALGSEMRRHVSLTFVVAAGSRLRTSEYVEQYVLERLGVQAEAVEVGYDLFFHFKTFQISFV